MEPKSEAAGEYKILIEGKVTRECNVWLHQEENMFPNQLYNGQQWMSIDLSLLIILTRVRVFYFQFILNVIINNDNIVMH